MVKQVVLGSVQPQYFDHYGVIQIFRGKGELVQDEVVAVTGFGLFVPALVRTVVKSPMMRNTELVTLLALPTL